MVAALTRSMIADSALIVSSLCFAFCFAASLHAITEVHVTDGQRKKCNRDCDPKEVFHAGISCLSDFTGRGLKRE
jgi:hypothetical protein